MKRDTGETKLGELVEFNPRERLKRGEIARKIPMEALEPFTKKIPLGELLSYQGGVKFKNGDTLVARITPSLENGKTSIVNCLDQGEVGFGSTEFIVLRAKEGITDPEYVYYLATDSYFRDVAIKSMTGSSGRQRVQTDVLKKLPVEIPSLAEQQKIAHTLSLLDAKIDLLRQQNETLEAMGAAVFREWFVEGANVSTIEEVAEHVRTSVKPQHNPEKEYQHFSLPAFDAKRRPVTEKGEEIRSGKYEVLNDCILVSKLNPRFPRVWLVGRAPQNAICSTEFQVFKPTDLNHLSFLYFFFLSPFAKNRLIMAASGTSGSHQRVRPSDIAQLEFSYESYDQIERFDELATPLLDKVERNNASIQELEDLRDLLLPKLMSGEVTIRP